MSEAEFKASGLLLDLGVSIPVRPPRFLNMKRKPWRITMYTPVTGSLIRISRIYLSVGISFEQMKDYTPEQNMEFMRQHGKKVARMVAFTIARGWISGKLFNTPLAWWLLWRVHPLMLQEAWFQMMNLLDLNPFRNIIRSAPGVNLMKPNLSHRTESRS